MDSPRFPDMNRAGRPHGLLLTGGTSRRMGADKAGQKVGGVAMGARSGRALLRAADPVLAVGPDPGLGLQTVADAGCGPLAALAAGMRHLAAAQHEKAVLVVACDLPFITPALLNLIADSLGGADAAVPVATGRMQPLAACYGPAVLEKAEALVSGGSLSMRALLAQLRINPVQESAWRAAAPAGALTDVDTPSELAAANLVPSGVK